MPRILVVEDEFLLAFALEDELAASGCRVVGPFFSLSQALAAVRTEVFDLAILDVNLNGEMVFPLADELTRREIPFVFLTGYSLSDLPPNLRHRPKLSKPHDSATLMKTIQAVLSV
jgi:DNA-binding response OmpR family regulator